MKKILAIFLALILCAGVLCGCGTSGDSEIVAKVGNEVITVGELKYAIEMVKTQSVGQLSGDQVEEFWTTEKDGKDTETYIREKAMELLMNLTVMAQAAADNKITVTDAEMKAYHDENKDALQQTMDTYGVSEEVVNSILRKQLLYNKYGQTILNYDERFNPTEEEMKELFVNNFLKAQHILIMTINAETGAPLSSAELEAAKTKIEDLLAQARAGADFKALMDEYSEDPGKEQAPDGYVFTEGEMVTEFYEGAQALSENEISDVIESGYGYHIIKRIPLDMETDFQANISKIQYFNMEQEELKLTEELKAKMTVTQDDNKIQSIPVRGE